MNRRMLASDGGVRRSGARLGRRSSTGISWDDLIRASPGGDAPLNDVRIAWTCFGKVESSPTLVRWISRSRDRQIEHPPAARDEDVVAELKRLRRENDILRQERDILKKATAFFAKEGSR